jgi:hypothetical protein
MAPSSAPGPGPAFPKGECAKVDPGMGDVGAVGGCDMLALANLSK